MLVYTNFKNLIDTELEQEDYRFNLKISNAELADDAWQELNSFFEKNPDSKEQYRYSYWRWFVILSWQKALSSSETTFLRLIGDQAPIAVLVNIDVMDLMIRYLAQNYYYREDIGGYFLKLQSAFLQSEAVVGVWHKKNVTVSELVKEIGSIYKSKDSLAIADFESRLRQIMFPGDEISKKYLTADSEQAKERFLDLVSFFQTFTEENIWFVIDAFLNPEKYQNVAPGGAPTATPVSVVTPKATTVKSVSQPSVASPKKEEFKPIAPPVPITSSQPTPQQIKSQIDKEFSAEDAEGNFVDIEGVYKKLGELAEKYNDLAINDLIYYDEGSGKFLWK